MCEDCLNHELFLEHVEQLTTWALAYGDYFEMVNVILNTDTDMEIAYNLFFISLREGVSDKVPHAHRLYFDALHAKAMLQ